MNSSLNNALALVLVLLAGCQCASGIPSEEGSTGVGTSFSSSTNLSTTFGASSVATVGTSDTDERFLAGVFHNENAFTPFGGEGPNLGGETLANVVFRTDGTATMWVEGCSTMAGIDQIDWKWSTSSSPWIDLTPGEGERSLRFLALSDVSSVRVAVDDECVMMFELDGEVHTFDTFHLGRACWVVRCEDDVTHVDYCEGEDIPVCP